MKAEIKLYIEDHVLYFLSDETSVIIDKNRVKIDDKEMKPAEIIEFIESQKLNKFTFYLIKENPEKYFNEFINKFKVIEAAGGLVKNKAGNYLMIFRLGKWDLPKGKIEKGETPSEAAVREVEEECSITGLVPEKFLLKTYHTYRMHGELIVKLTHWYQINCISNALPKPQLEEHITKVEWTNSKKISLNLSNTYGSIKDVFNTVTGFDFT